MEAASYKLPVIASDIDANREFLGEDAIYVRPENKEDLTEAIEHAIANPVQMRGFVETNYKKILQKYTWDKVARKYEAYLKQIVKD
jgi:glycosyltransferase involved in cell wall biosynthesis